MLISAGAFFLPAGWAGGKGRCAAGLPCGSSAQERKALWRDSDTVPEAGIVNKK